MARILTTVLPCLNSKALLVCLPLFSGLFRFSMKGMLPMDSYLNPKQYALWRFGDTENIGKYEVHFGFESGKKKKKVEHS